MFSINSAPLVMLTESDALKIIVVVIGLQLALQITIGVGRLATRHTIIPFVVLHTDTNSTVNGSNQLANQPI